SEPGQRARVLHADTQSQHHGGGHGQQESLHQVRCAGQRGDWPEPVVRGGEWDTVVGVFRERAVVVAGGGWQVVARSAAERAALFVWRKTKPRSFGSGCPSWRKRMGALPRSG